MRVWHWGWEWEFMRAPPEGFDSWEDIARPRERGPVYRRAVRFIGPPLTSGARAAATGAIARTTSGHAITDLMFLGLACAALDLYGYDWNVHLDGWRLQDEPDVAGKGIIVDESLEGCRCAYRLDGHLVTSPSLASLIEDREGLTGAQRLLLYQKTPVLYVPARKHSIYAVRNVDPRVGHAVLP